MSQFDELRDAILELSRQMANLAAEVAKLRPDTPVAAVRCFRICDAPCGIWLMESETTGTFFSEVQGASRKGHASLWTLSGLEADPEVLEINEASVLRSLRRWPSTLAEATAIFERHRQPRQGTP